MQEAQIRRGEERGWGRKEEERNERKPFVPRDCSSDGGKRDDGNEWCKCTNLLRLYIDNA